MTGDFTPPGGPAPASPGAQRPGDPQQPAPSGTTRVSRASRPMAIAAWTAIAAGVAILVGISWSAALSLTGRALEPADPSETGTMSALRLVPGMCLAAVGDDGAVADAEVVDCAEPHLGEVVTSLEFDLARFPGDDAVAQEALEHCASRLDGLLEDGDSWVAWVPTAPSWQRDDKTALCIAVFAGPQDGTLRPQPVGDEDAGPQQEA